MSLQDALYFPVLVFHNAFRWIVLVVGLSAIISACWGWAGGKSWTALSPRLSALFVGSLDLQLTVGFVLYFGLSPITRSVFTTQRPLGDREANFFNLIHIGLMILSVVVAHAGKIVASRTQTPTGKHRRAALLYMLALTLMLAGIPWWRPLIRL